MEIEKLANYNRFLVGKCNVTFNFVCIKNLLNLTSFFRHDGCNEESKTNDYIKKNEDKSRLKFDLVDGRFVTCHSFILKPTLKQILINICIC